MLHHVSVGTNDLERAQRFYDAVLTPVGLRLMESKDGERIYGSAMFQFSVLQPVDGKPASPGNGVHIAFGVGDRASVDEFHAAALAHGGTDDGPPGLRPQYNGHYYGAFVLDLDGNKIEAVTYSAE